jgi:hypothetical protein
MEGCGCPLDYEYSKFLFYTSFLIGLSCIISIYFNDTYITMYFLLLFLSSINFWRKPEYGLRRNIDLLLVKCGVICGLYLIYLMNSSFYRIMFLFVFFSIIFFDIAERICCYFNSTKWIIFHMAMHIYVLVMVLFMFTI